MYADLPTTPGFSSELSDLVLSRGVSMYDCKSGELKSAKSRYNARMGLMDLMDRSGACHVPGERWEPPTPISKSTSSEHEHDPTPSLEDPVLQMEKSNLTNHTNTSRGSQKSFDNMKMAERTMTNLSHVGPLPSFMPRGNSDGKSYDAISTDSAFESGFSASEYAHSIEGHSHYSEMMTVSHADQQSSKGSVSETNEMFDVEHPSEVGDDEVEKDDNIDEECHEGKKEDEVMAKKILGLIFDENLEDVELTEGSVDELFETLEPVLAQLSPIRDDEEEDEDEEDDGEMA